MEGGTVTMLLSDLHKIGPSDTPISSSSPPPPPTLPAPFQAGLAWLAGELRRGTACKHPDTHPGTQGTWVLGYLTPTSPGGNAPWPVQAQPGPNLTPQANSSQSSNSPLAIDASTPSWHRYHTARPLRRRKPCMNLPMSVSWQNQIPGAPTSSTLASLTLLPYCQAISSLV